MQIDIHYLRIVQLSIQLCQKSIDHFICMIVIPCRHPYRYILSFDAFSFPDLLTLFSIKKFTGPRISYHQPYGFREASDISIIDQALRKGLDDPYEMLRRMAASYAENYGAPDMLEAIAGHYLDPQEGSRVRYHLLNAFSLYPAESVEKALRSAWDGIWPTAEDFEAGVKRICNSIRSSDADLSALAKGEGSEKDRAFTVSHQRNACIPAAIDPMIAIVSDENSPQDLRLKAAEALGWYTHSFRRQEIYARLKAVKVTDSALADEIYRTLRRLEDNAHTK